MRLPGIVGRYLYPARMVPPTRHNLERVAGSLAAAYARSDLAAAGPAAVGIDVSDACNIACAICAREVDRDPRRRALVSLDEFKHIYDQIRPVYLSLSGYGETLLNKHVPAMIAHATASGSVVQLITNGTLLDDGHVDALFGARLNKLKVSLDAAEPTLYARVREGADFERVVGNVERLLLKRDALRLSGPVVEVQCTLFRENIDQIEGILDLCRSRLHGADPYFHIMFTYGEQAGFVARTLPSDDATAIGHLQRGIPLARRYGFIRAANALQTALTQLTQDLSNSPCYVPWYSCIISTDGDVYPCCYHTVRGTHVGNVHTTPFAEIWNGPAMQQFRRQLRTSRCDDKVCATCRYEDTPMERVFGAAARVPGLAGIRTPG